MNVSRCVFAHLCMGVFVTCAFAQSRRFTVASSIAFSTVADHPGENGGGPMVIAPNGKAAVFVTSRGLLEENKVESTLWLVDAGMLRRCLGAKAAVQTMWAFHPRLLVRMKAIPRAQSSESRAPILSSIRWAADSSSVFFLAEDSHDHRRLYQVKVAAPRIRRISGARQNVKSYDLRGDVLVYSEALPLKADKSSSETPYLIDGLSLADILFPGADTAFSAGLRKMKLWHVSLTGSLQRQAVPRNGSNVSEQNDAPPLLALSPDGRELVQIAPLEHAPEEWREYEPVPGRPEWRIDPNSQTVTSAANRWRLRQYTVTDLQTGRIESLLDAPIGQSLGSADRIAVRWANDGRRILLGNSTLPLKGSTGAERERRKQVCAVVVVDFPSMRNECVVESRDSSPAATTVDRKDRLQLTEIDFGSDDNQVMVHLVGGGMKVTEKYHFEGTGWKKISSVTSPSNEASKERVWLEQYGLSIHEAFNQPPELWVIDRANGVTQLLWSPNPHWTAQDFSQATEFHWTDSTGYKWSGILIAPLNFIAGHRYPLIIQTHGAPLNKFLIDGKYPTAEAARALASNGFFVLQIPYRTDHVDTLQEASDQLRGYKSAISQLDKLMLIDRKRVGIVGFSRTGFHVEEALIHDPGLFAAAVIADATDMSYMPYRLFSQGDSFVSDNIETIIGAKPYGTGLNRWTTYASDFHADRIQVPVLVQALGPASVLLEWELYTSIKEAGGTVHVLYIPQGQHLLQAPKDLFVSQSSTVQWFCVRLEQSQCIPSFKQSHMGLGEWDPGRGR